MGIFTNLNWCNRRISEPPTGAYPNRFTRIFPTPHQTPTTGGRETLPFVELGNLQLFKLLELFEGGHLVQVQMELPTKQSSTG